MNRLFVISGVTGMTGNELARQIIGRGEKVIGFDNFFASSIETVRDLLESDSFSFHNYDINNPEQMAEIEKEVLEAKSSVSDVVYINCAAVVHTEHFYNIEATFQTNVVGMKTFMEQAIRVGASIYINCSTSEVYSMCSFKEGGVKESDYVLMATAEHSQRTSYATGKLLTEFMIKDAVDKGFIKGCSIRFANVYSKNELYPKHILPHIITSLSKTGEVTLLENAKKTYRTFLSNEDSCSAVLCLIDTDSALDGTAYNVGTDEEIYIIDLVYMCADELGIKDPKIKFSGTRLSDPERRLLNTEKIRERTGWSPMVNVRDGIKAIVGELKK